MEYNIINTTCFAVFREDKQISELYSSRGEALAKAMKLNLITSRRDPYGQRIETFLKSGFFIKKISHEVA